MQYGIIFSTVLRSLKQILHSDDLRKKTFKEQFPNVIAKVSSLYLIVRIFVID